MLEVGQIIDNSTLVSHFKVGNMGGMRRSHATNSLVLVSDHTKGIYDDRWVGNVCHYTGMGLKGDQTLTSQNRTVNESEQSGVQLHLFEVHIPGRYRYRGRVKLSGLPRQEMQPDITNTPRKVWIFPLQLIDTSHPDPISAYELESLQSSRTRKSQKLSLDELRLRAISARTNPAAIITSTKTYYRNSDIAEYARRRAKGRCELCLDQAPFIGKDGAPHLEVHHIEWLSRGGEDSVENTVALCPNCHRKMHILDSALDKEKLKARVRP